MHKKNKRVWNEYCRSRIIMHKFTNPVTTSQSIALMILVISIIVITASIVLLKNKKMDV